MKKGIRMEGVSRNFEFHFYDISKEEYCGSMTMENKTIGKDIRLAHLMQVVNPVWRYQLF
jgi:hypothetical protein